MSFNVYNSLSTDSGGIFRSYEEIYAVPEYAQTF